MSDLVATYVPREGKFFAFFEGNVIAEGNSFKEAEQSAVEYLESLSKSRKETEKETSRKRATHIVTPNGLKGEILGRTSGVWGEKDITVRLENGRIVKLNAHTEDGFQFVNERTAAAPDSPIDELKTELDKNYEKDKVSLASRYKDLDRVIAKASSLVNNQTSYSETSELDKIVLLAESEKKEVGDALAYLEQADSEAVTSSFEYKAAEQAELGRKDDWLDHLAKEILSENEEENYDKVLAEEPALLAASLETGTLADQGSTAEVAYSHILAKTAMYVGDEVEGFREKFVAAVEQARRSELADRQSQIREASVEEETPKDGDAEGLFL